jgi:hypothetical protein
MCPVTCSTGLDVSFNENGGDARRLHDGARYVGIRQVCQRKEGKQ